MSTGKWRMISARTHDDGRCVWIGDPRAAHPERHNDDRLQRRGAFLHAFATRVEGWGAHVTVSTEVERVTRPGAQDRDVSVREIPLTIEETRAMALALMQAADDAEAFARTEPTAAHSVHPQRFYEQQWRIGDEHTATGPIVSTDCDDFAVQALWSDVDGVIIDLNGVELPLTAAVELADEIRRLASLTPPRAGR
jgi:hypothetical protein